ncbi:MAG: hypothetical protein ACHQWU_15500 [Gemmatimonadales bacterium]
MRRSVFGSTLGVLVLAGACASGNTPETSATPQFDQPIVLTGAARDSAVAQAIADREGPRVSIHANILNTSGLRRVRADFYTEDDAYVLVGQIDASGVLRVVFPAQPGDDGFVHGQHSYQTPEFLAGFVDQFRYRYNTTYHNASSARDSYDGGIGYVFVLASWRPLRLDHISSGGEFDSYELADASYMSDPRSAIQELASVLAGDNREAYTLRYARYSDTQTDYAGSAASDELASDFGYGYCSGFAPLGFGFSPFDASTSRSNLVPLGESFFYQGTYYSYDQAEGCYRSSPGYFNSYQSFGVFTPQPNPLGGRRRSALDATAHRPPLRPTPPPQHRFPKIAVQDAGTPSRGQTNARVAPDYRHRGLITTDGPSSGPERLDAHARLKMPGQDGATAGTQRPSIQQMVNQGQPSMREGSGWSRARVAPVDNESRGYTRPVDASRPSIERSEPARQAPPRVESAPRSAPPPAHIEAPRSAPPPPARTEPSSGSSGSSSSGGGHPIKPSHL